MTVVRVTQAINNCSGQLMCESARAQTDDVISTNDVRRERFQAAISTGRPRIYPQGFPRSHGMPRQHVALNRPRSLPRPTRLTIHNLPSRQLESPWKPTQAWLGFARRCRPLRCEDRCAKYARMMRRSCHSAMLSHALIGISTKFGTRSTPSRRVTSSVMLHSSTDRFVKIADGTII